MYKCQLVDEAGNVYEKEVSSFNEAIKFIEEVENNFIIVSRNINRC